MAITQPNIYYEPKKDVDVFGALGNLGSLSGTIGNIVQNRLQRKEQQRQFDTTKDLELWNQVVQSTPGGFTQAAKENPALVKRLLGYNQEVDYDEGLEEERYKEYQKLYPEAEGIESDAYRKWVSSGKWKDEIDWKKRDLRQFEDNDAVDQMYESLSRGLMKPADRGELTLATRLQEGVKDKVPEQQYQDQDISSRDASYTPLTKEKYETLETTIPPKQVGAFKPLEQTTSDVRSPVGDKFGQIPLNNSKNIVADPNSPDRFYTDLVGIMDLAGRVKEETGQTFIKEANGNWLEKSAYEQKYNINPGRVYSYDGPTKIDEFDIEKNRGLIDPEIPQNSSTFVENYIDPDQFSNIDNWNEVKDATMEGITTPGSIQTQEIKSGQVEIGNYNKNNNTFTFYEGQQESANAGTLNEIVKLANPSLSLDNPVMKMNFAASNGWRPDDMPLDMWYKQGYWRNNKQLTIPVAEDIPLENTISSAGGETKPLNQLEYEKDLYGDAEQYGIDYGMASQNFNSDQIIRHRSTQEWKDYEDKLMEVSRYNALQFRDSNGKFNQKAFDNKRKMEDAVIENFGGMDNLIQMYIPNQFKLDTFKAMSSVMLEAEKMKLLKEELNFKKEMAWAESVTKLSGAIPEQYKNSMNDFNKVVKEQFNGDVNKYLENYGQGNVVHDSMFDNAFRAVMYSKGIYTPEEIEQMIMVKGKVLKISDLVPLLSFDDIIRTIPTDQVTPIVSTEETEETEETPTITPEKTPRTDRIYNKLYNYDEGY